MMGSSGYKSWHVPSFGMSWFLLPVLIVCVMAFGGFPTWAASATDDGVIWGGKYDDVLAAARKEGQVVLAFGGAASRGFRPVTEVFEKKFAIKTVQSLGSGAAQVDRMLSEQRAGTWAVDVVLVGANSGVRFVTGDRLAEIKPLLFLPEVLDQSLWFKGQHWYGDYPENRYMFTYAADGTPPYSNIAYNTKLFDPREFNSVWDVLDPKWKGKIVATPPTMAGQGETWPMAYVHPDIGPKWVERLMTEMDVFFTEDTRTAFDGIAHGRWAFGIFMGSPGEALVMSKDGLPISLLADTLKPLKEANVLRGSGAMSNLMVPKIQPNPNATKVFLNWYLSREGQETMMRFFQLGTTIPSLREDITEWGPVLQQQQRKAGVDYLFVTHDPAFLERRDEAMDFLKETYLKATGQK